MESPITTPEPTDHPFVVTVANRPVHVGMAPAFFDDAVNRSFQRDLIIAPTTQPGQYRVQSVSQPGVTYIVSATRCGCAGSRSTGRCLHRARVIWEQWYAAQDAADDQTAA